MLSANGIVIVDLHVEANLRAWLNETIVIVGPVVVALGLVALERMRPALVMFLGLPPLLRCHDILAEGERLEVRRGCRGGRCRRLGLAIDRFVGRYRHILRLK